jgi:hypothetical protein
MKTTTKQTAANNAFLAACKRLFNAPIAKRVAEILNDATIADRAAATRDYLQSVGVTTDPQAMLARMGK